MTKQNNDEELEVILIKSFHNAWAETQPVGKWVARDYDSTFPLTLPSAKQALNALINKARIDELRSIPTYPNGLSEYIDDRIQALTKANNEGE